VCGYHSCDYEDYYYPLGDEYLCFLGCDDMRTSRSSQKFRRNVQYALFRV
jgi:hypothetical protein